MTRPFPLRQTRRSSAALTALALAACTAFDVSFRNKEPFDPPDGYTEWWAATESCSGRAGDLARVSWYTASSITSDDIVARGLWSPPHEIVIVLGYENDEVTVRHEMLHDLLAGDPDHQSPLWATCGLIPD